MVLVSEEIIGWLDVFMKNTVAMAIIQRSGSLKGDATELIEITVQMILLKGASLQILHQFIAAVLSVYIHLSEIVELDHHLELKAVDASHQLLVDVIIGIIDLQHIFLSSMIHQKDLSLARVLAQRTHEPILFAFQCEHLPCVLNGRIIHRLLPVYSQGVVNRIASILLGRVGYCFIGNDRPVGKYCPIGYHRSVAGHRATKNRHIHSTTCGLVYIINAIAHEDLRIKITDRL